MVGFKTPEQEEKRDPPPGSAGIGGNHDPIIYTFFPRFQVFSEKRLAFPLTA